MGKHKDLAEGASIAIVASRYRFSCKPCLEMTFFPKALFRKRSSKVKPKESFRKSCHLLTDSNENELRATSAVPPYKAASYTCSVEPRNPETFMEKAAKFFPSCVFQRKFPNS